MLTGKKTQLRFPLVEEFDCGGVFQCFVCLFYFFFSFLFVCLVVWWLLFVCLFFLSWKCLEKLMPAQIYDPGMWKPPHKINYIVKTLFWEWLLLKVQYVLDKLER